MKPTNPLEDLKEIRKMMETSTKFLSLSGLSGISAGLVALIGSVFAYNLLKTFEHRALQFYLSNTLEEETFRLDMKLLALAINDFSCCCGTRFFVYL